MERNEMGKWDDVACYQLIQALSLLYGSHYIGQIWTVNCCIIAQLLNTTLSNVHGN
jgi:hypothetical protein